MPCSLSDVRIYSGRPDPNRDKRSHEAVQPVEGERSDRGYARPPIPANLAQQTRLRKKASMLPWPLISSGLRSPALTTSVS